MQTTQEDAVPSRENGEDIIGTHPGVKTEGASQVDDPAEGYSGSHSEKHEIDDLTQDAMRYAAPTRPVSPETPVAGNPVQAEQLEQQPAPGYAEVARALGVNLTQLRKAQLDQVQV